MKLIKPQAAKAAELFGLSKSEEAMLNEVPMRGTPMPPTDPLIYRFYELVMVNGPAWKALIEEEFGDGIMSAIDFDLQMERAARSQGRPGQDHHVGQVPALQILRQQRQRPGLRVQGGIEDVRAGTLGAVRARVHAEERHPYAAVFIGGHGIWALPRRRLWRGCPSTIPDSSLARGAATRCLPARMMA